MLLASLAITAVAIVSIVGTALYLTSGSLIYARWTQHTSVALVLFPLAAGLSLMAGVTGSSIVTQLHDLANSLEGLPSALKVLLLATRAAEANISFTDVQAMVCVLFVAYGSVLVWRHLIDITRLLRISRRRLIQPEVDEQRMIQKTTETKKN